MLLFRWVYPPLSTRQKIKKWVCVRKKLGPKRKHGVYKKMKSGLNGVGSNSNGLILWENDAARLGIIFEWDF